MHRRVHGLLGAPVGKHCLKQTNHVKRITSKVQVNLLYIFYIYMNNCISLFVSLVSYNFWAGDMIEYNRTYKFICDDLFYSYIFYSCMIECTVINSNTLCCLLLYRDLPLNNNTMQKHLAINVMFLYVLFIFF